jgi:hypothetical protein
MHLCMRKLQGKEDKAGVLGNPAAVQIQTTMRLCTRNWIRQGGGPDQVHALKFLGPVL